MHLRPPEALSLPGIPGVLVRSRMTESQTRLNAFERRTNVDGAFDVPGAEFDGRSVLLVDDVCTTGSTLQACADALRSAGAVGVYALTVARSGWDTKTGATDDADKSTHF